MEKGVHDTSGRPGDISAHLRPHQVQAEPLILVVKLIVEDDRRSAVVDHDHIRAAVIVQVSDGESSSRIACSEGRPTESAYILEAMAVVVKEEKRLSIV